MIMLLNVLYLVGTVVLSGFEVQKLLIPRALSSLLRMCPPLSLTLPTEKRTTIQLKGTCQKI